MKVGTSDRRVNKLYKRIHEQAEELHNCLFNVIDLLNALDAKFTAIKQFSAIKQPFTAKVLLELKELIENPKSLGGTTSSAVKQAATNYTKKIRDENINPGMLEKENEIEFNLPKPTPLPPQAEAEGSNPVTNILKFAAIIAEKIIMRQFF